MLGRKFAYWVGSILAIIILLVGSIIAYFHGCGNIGDKLFADICAALSVYPQMNEPTIYSEFYFCDGVYEYFYLQMNNRVISGKRGTNHDTIFYFKGKAWRLNNEGAFCEIGEEPDPVIPLIQNSVSKLLSDSKLSYTYGKAKGLPLPLWVNSGEQYLICERPNLPEYEVMAFDQADGEYYIRWVKADTTEDVNISLYLVLCSDYQETAADTVVTIPGWGELPDVNYPEIIEEVRS